MCWVFNTFTLYNCIKNIADNDVYMYQLHDQLDTFKTNLQEFAQKYRKGIRRDPTFRMHFQQMCTKIGVDPLACK